MSNVPIAQIIAKAGSPVLGASLLIYVVLNSLVTLGLIKGPEVTTKPSYNERDVRSIQQLDDIDDRTTRLEMKLDSHSDYTKEILDAVREQTKAIDKLVNHLEYSHNR